MEVFVIYDNRLGEFSEHGKAFYHTRGAAKAALGLGYYRKNSLYCDISTKFNEDELDSAWLNDKSSKADSLKFKNQTRFECRRYVLGKSGYEVV